MALSDLQGVTPASLNGMTKAAIIASILEGQTTTEVVRTPAPNGDNGTLVETTKNFASGAVIGSRETSWNYYVAGEVNEVLVIEKGAAGKETKRRTIKHYKDGRQPTLLKVAKEMI